MIYRTATREKSSTSCVMLKSAVEGREVVDSDDEEAPEEESKMIPPEAVPTAGAAELVVEA